MVHISNTNLFKKVIFSQKAFGYQPKVNIFLYICLQLQRCFSKTFSLQVKVWEVWSCVKIKSVDITHLICKKFKYTAKVFNVEIELYIYENWNVNVTNRSLNKFSLFLQRWQ